MKKHLQLILPVLMLFGCEENNDEARSTWKIIEQDILTPSCVNCHMKGTAIMKQSGLDLSEGNAYNAMVGVQPKNTAAKNEDLYIVSLSLIHI